MGQNMPFLFVLPICSGGGVGVYGTDYPFDLLTF